MIRRTSAFAVAIALLINFAIVPYASAAVVAGFFNDPTNSALIASDGYADLRAPRFAGDDDIARNVAVYRLTVMATDSFRFSSLGYALGGAEPYLSLFAGSGLGATFVDSSYFDPAIDFDDTFTLASGSYLVALGVYVNESFAENNPDADPTFADGFTALGDPSLLGSSFYRLEVTSLESGGFTIVPAAPVPPPNDVPEPATWSLSALGLAALALRRRPRLAVSTPLRETNA